MQLFALQVASSTEDASQTWIFVIAIITIALLFVGILCWLIIRPVAKSRELSHLERMKALELGRAIGPSEAEKCQNKYLDNAFWICFWIGGVVPIAATSAAGTAMIQMNTHEFGIILAIWICVAVLSVASVICATTLMISSRQWSSKGEKYASGNGKAG